MFGGTKIYRGWLKWWIIGTLNTLWKNCADFSSFDFSANFRLSSHVRRSFTLPPPFLNSLESKSRFFLNGLYSSELESSELESRRLFLLSRYWFFLNTLRFFLNGLYSFELESSETESRHLFLLSRHCFFLNTLRFFLNGLYSFELESYSRCLFFRLFSVSFCVSFSELFSDSLESKCVFFLILCIHLN